MKNVDFAKLLQDSLKVEGKISSAYSVFHDYSVNNMLFAMAQLEAMKIEIAPIATFNKWKSLGIKLNKGAKAISLIVPSTKKYVKENEEGAEEEKTITFFNMKKGWFSMSQTNADEKTKKEMIKAPKFDLEKALASLKIKMIKFDHLNGNCMGFARGREIAINPVNPLKHKTTFHEMAHVLLGHTAAHGEQSDQRDLPRDIKELEAESVAYLCISALDLEGAEYSRGYIQNWFNSDEYPQRSAQRVMKCADEILKAGAIK